MEIYQEPTVRDRKVGVSFVDEPPSRTPLLPRSGRKPLGTHNYQGTPHTNKRKSVGFTPKTSEKPATNTRTPVSIRTQDKENSTAKTPIFFTSTMSPPLTVRSDASATPSSAQAFRRALRGKTPGHSGSGSKLGPPLRMAPKTPASLLRTELDDTFNAEESLLVSPTGAVFNMFGTSGHQVTTSTGLVIVPPKAAETIQRLASSQKKDASVAREVDVDPTSSIANMDWKSPRVKFGTSKPSGTAPKRTPTSSSSLQQSDSTPIQTSNSEKGVVMDLSSMFSNEKTKKNSSTKEPTSEKNKSGFWSLEIPHDSAKPSTPKPAVSKPAEKNAALPEKQSKGVAMDMSDMFATETDESTKKTTPPPHLLKRLQRPSIRKDSREPVQDVSNLKRDPRKSATSKSLGNSNSNNPPVSAALKKTSTNQAARRTQRGIPFQSAKISTSIVETKENSIPRKTTSSSQSNFHRDLKTKGSSPSRDRLPKKVENLKRLNGKPVVRGGSIAAGQKSSPVKKGLIKASTPPKKLHKSPIKAMYAPDDWAGKQCETFQHWLNYKFDPTEEEEDNAHTTSSRSGLRALVIHRRLAQVRFRAAELFQSDAMRRARGAVQSEIARGRLAIRSDRDVHADLSLRKLAVQLLLSYTTPWLRLGLEVMFGECIMPEDLQEAKQGEMTPVARMRATLKTFVVNRVLTDHSVLMKYTKGRTNVPSGKFEKLYREEMRTLVLYRMMVLILFLDRAKMTNVLDTAPRLFAKSSDVKSSKAVLLSFCRNFLSSEGDFIKHLSRIGLKVSYVQDPIDELGFKVSNLATDLRDGSRLTRLTEIVTDAHFKSVMKKLRLPSVSRLQKMHNVNVAFSRLKEQGIHLPADINAHHIVDAHREMVLKLMWAVVAHSCVSKLLQGGHVELEIANVLRSNQARRKVQGQGLCIPDKFSPLKNGSANESPEQTMKNLLFRWCQAVCNNYGIQLTDFTSSFADGRALCYLVHYYHPGIIPLRDILPTSSESDPELSPDQALRNQRSNSLMVARRISDLGGIPRMLPIMDTTNPPDEKSMLLCLTYLCSRLMESSKEIFATILIQAYYRRYKEKILLEKKEAAAFTIYQLWCKHKHQYYASLERRYVASVRVLEAFILTHKHSLERMKRIRLAREGRQAAALNIQRSYRGYHARSLVLSRRETHHAATHIQKTFRRFQAQMKFLEAIVLKECAIHIQSGWRSFLSQRSFQNQLTAARRLQSFCRGMKVRADVKEMQIAAMVIQEAWWTYVDVTDSHVAAVLIQSQWRGVMARKCTGDMRAHENAAITIQRVWRGQMDLILYSLKRECAISIQRVVRGDQSRRRVALDEKRLAAVSIQKIVRGFSAQVQYQMDLFDIITIQSLLRRRTAIRDTIQRIDAVGIIQCATRCALARRRLGEVVERRDIAITLNDAAVICQSFWRKCEAKKKLLHLQVESLSSIIIQRNWRRCTCRQSFLVKVKAATLIQSRVRCRKAMATWKEAVKDVCLIQLVARHFLHRRKELKAATRIQSVWRQLLAQRSFDRGIYAVKCIQRYFRGYSSRAAMNARVKAASRIQAAWRGFWAKYNYELDVLEVVICQSVVRRVLSLQRRSKRLAAVQVIQNFARRSNAIKIVSSMRQHRADCIARRNAATLIQAYQRRRNAMDLRSTRAESIVALQAFARKTLKSRKFHIMKESAIRLQSVYRSFLSRKVQLNFWSMATVIQSAWRTYITCSHFQLQRGSATIIQSQIRRRIASALVHSQMQAIVKIQASFRRTRARLTVVKMSNALQEFRLEKNAATMIQSLARRARSKSLFLKKKWLSIHIQSLYRGHMARISFEMDYLDVLLCQCVCRRWIAKREAKRREQAVLVFQKSARRRIASRKVASFLMERKEVMLQNLSASTVQALFRGYLARRNMEALHFYATRLQSAFRGHYSYVSYQLLIADVTIIQSLARKWLAIRHQARFQQCASIIQAGMRGLRARRTADKYRRRKQRLQLESNCAVIIQSRCRSLMAVKKFRRLAAARQIQKTWRCFAAHVDYLLKQIMVIRLQKSARGFLCRRKFVAMKSGIIKIQAVCRGVHQRVQFAMADTAATSIQTAFRGFTQRIDYMKARNAGITIQRMVRGHLVRDELELSHFAASEIQRSWRGFVRFCDYVIALDAAVKMQSVIRMARTKQDFRRKKLYLYAEQRFEMKSAEKIQRAYRMYRHRRLLGSAACAIQRLVRGYIKHRRATVVSRGIVALQAVFRARKIRRRRPKKVSVLARRVSMANIKARQNPKLKIGYKTRYALRVLQTSNSLAEIMDAVKSLETSTRLSQLCCVLFTEADAARILLDLIRSCNRSIPHVELVQCILLTLDNVAAYSKLVYSFADCNSAEIFLDKMQMFRDKDVIFCLTVSLLGKIAKCNPMVEEFCAMHEHFKRLKALYELSVKRSKPRPHGSRKPTKKPNRMKRRSDFDRLQAIRHLGSMVDAFAKLHSMRVAANNPGTTRTQRFTFDQ